MYHDHFFFDYCFLLSRLTFFSYLFLFPRLPRFHSLPISNFFFRLFSFCLQYMYLLFLFIIRFCLGIHSHFYFYYPVHLFILFLFISLLSLPKSLYLVSQIPLLLRLIPFTLLPSPLLSSLSVRILFLA